MKRFLFEEPSLELIVNNLGEPCKRSREMLDTRAQALLGTRLGEKEHGIRVCCNIFANLCELANNIIKLIRLDFVHIENRF